MIFMLSTEMIFVCTSRTWHGMVRLVAFLHSPTLPDIAVNLIGKEIVFKLQFQSHFPEE
jgi:hypothetical protein